MFATCVGSRVDLTVGFRFLHFIRMNDVVNFNVVSEVVKSDAVLASLVERSAQRWVPGVSGSAPFVPGVVARADPVSAAVSAALPASLVGIRE